MTIPLTPTERIIITRAGMQNTVQYQVKETDGWETKTRKSYDGSWKGNLVDDMKEHIKSFKKQQKARVYGEQKLKPYH